MTPVPALMPVTSPVADTDAIEGLLLAHVPPATVLVSVETLPVQIKVVPEITPAEPAALTVMV